MSYRLLYVAASITAVLVNIVFDVIFSHPTVSSHPSQTHRNPSPEDYHALLQAKPRPWQHTSDIAFWEPACPPQTPEPQQPLTHSQDSCSSPPVGCHGDPPALDLTQLRIGDLNLQWQAGHPNGDLHLGSEVLVGEVDNRAHFALHLLPVHKDRITGVGDLGEGEARI